jgi:hypothetical protein
MFIYLILTLKLELLPSERLEAAFEGRLSDVMPWFADLTYWYSAQSAKGTLPSKYKNDKRLNLYKDLGCGAHEELYRPVSRVKYKQVKVNTYEQIDQDGSRTRHTMYRSPVGDLRRIDRFSSLSHSTATVEYPVKSEQDMKVLKFILRDQIIEKDLEAYEWQLKMIEHWEGWGIVSSLPPRTPFIRMIVEWAGFSNVVKLQWRYNEEFNETIQVMCECDDPIYDAIVDSPAKFVYFGENLSSDLVSPRMFKTYLEPYYKRRASQLHIGKKRIFLHIDGSLRGLLPLLGEAGIDCAQSLTPMPAGDVHVKDLRRLAGDRIVLWGGLPGVLFSKAYSCDILMQVLEDIIDCYLYDSKFIVGVADQVPPDGEIERVKMISDVLGLKGRR